MTREIISQTKLNELVHDTLNELVKTRQEFSAYQITKMLRDTYPNVEIDHLGVRDSVHYFMTENFDPDIFGVENCIIQDYSVEWRTASDGNPARVYFYSLWDNPQAAIAIAPTIQKVIAPTSNTLGLPSIIWEDDDN